MNQSAVASVPTVPSSIESLVLRALRTFPMIEAGDRIAVGISGGKDSLLLWSVLRHLQRRQDMRLELVGVHLDQHQPGFDREGFDALMRRFDVDLHVVSEDTWSRVESTLAPGQIPCSICGRLRRGILNRWCAEQGYNRLALGHHLDDAIETFFLNLFFRRQLDPLKAITPSDTGVATIRPLILVEERKIIAWQRHHEVQAVACPVCDQWPDSSRRNLGVLLEQMREVHPELEQSVRDALYGAADVRKPS
jgi:tRNA 2-thiocytidine biosynthesis protein TtcA